MSDDESQWFTVGVRIKATEVAAKEFAASFAAVWTDAYGDGPDVTIDDVSLVQVGNRWSPFSVGELRDIARGDLSTEMYAEVLAEIARRS